MANKIDMKMEIWKKKLLDMGMRNRLLNYKDTKRGNINIQVEQFVGSIHREPAIGKELRT